MPCSYQPGHKTVLVIRPIFLANGLAMSERSKWGGLLLDKGQPHRGPYALGLVIKVANRPPEKLFQKTLSLRKARTCGPGRRQADRTCLAANVRARKNRKIVRPEICSRGRFSHFRKGPLPALAAFITHKWPDVCRYRNCEKSRAKGR